MNQLLILLIYTPKWKGDLQALKMWQLCSWKIISIVFSLLKRKALSFPFFFMLSIIKKYYLSHRIFTLKIMSMSNVSCRCKYLYLLFDDSFLVDRNYIFTTEGHPLPVLRDWHDRLPESYIPTNWSFAQVFFLFACIVIDCWNSSFSILQRCFLIEWKFLQTYIFLACIVYSNLFVLL